MASTTSVKKLGGLAAFTFLSSEDDKHPAWESILQDDVASFWLTCQSTRLSSASARGWAVTLSTSDTFITIYPVFNEATGTTNIMCKHLATTTPGPQGSAFQKMMSLTSTRLGRAAVPETKVIDVLTKIQESGIAYYGLVCGRGLRFWIALFLFQIKQYIKEPTVYNKLPETSLRILRECYNDNRVVTGRVRNGYCIPDKWTKEAFENLQICLGCNKEVTFMCDGGWE